MDVKETIEAARDSMTVRRVYGDPYERNGVTVIPAASLQGGAGGGSGEEPEGKTGGGGGFGLRARPVGRLRDPRRRRCTGNPRSI